MSFLSSFLPLFMKNAFLAFILGHGALGYFVISYVWSLVFIPGAPEIFVPFLIYLKLDPNLIFLALWGGAVLGHMTDFYIGRAGDYLFKIKEKDIKKFKNMLDKWGEFGVFFAALLPPPFPFDAFTVAVGFLGMNSKKYLAFQAMGNAIKYATIVMLAKYGLKFLTGV